MRPFQKFLLPTLMFIFSDLPRSKDGSLLDKEGKSVVKHYHFSLFYRSLVLHYFFPELSVVFCPGCRQEVSRTPPRDPVCPFRTYLTRQRLLRIITKGYLSECRVPTNSPFCDGPVPVYPVAGSSMCITWFHSRKEKCGVKLKNKTRFLF